MDEIRAILAGCFFLVGCYLVYDLFTTGFDWTVLVGCIAGFVIAHYMWPKQHASESAWYDVAEFVIDLPFRSIAAALRSVSKSFRGDDMDID